MAFSSRNLFLIAILAVILFASNAHAFGAGNIASISAIEGKNWRHGDIEDLLKQVTCIRHHKWNSMMIKRVYFGNWLRDYSQAMDTGALKKANGETIRVLVWLLSFLGFGYATAEFEVTSERLGVYRPEEHIDNPKNYNDDQDARPYDPRLRGPIRPIELEIDPATGMKNYIASKGDWATSAAFVKYSFERSIHYGRLYTQGGHFSKGKDEDLAEGLRLLGQGLHTLEDFGAHTNYIELALIEMGHRNVFPLVGTQTGITLQGKHVFPLVTGTFGMVDFYHSVLGEATDHFTQSEISEMDNALGIAQSSAQSSNPLTTLIKLLSKVPGTRDLCAEAEQLQAASQAQARMNSSRGYDGGSTRGVDDYSGGTRAGPGDYNQSGYSAYDTHSGYQQPHQQGHDYNQSQQPSWDQQNQGYQQQSWQQPHDQSYHQPPQQQYGQPQDHQSYSSQPPQHQSYNQPGQQQWTAPPNPQGYGSQQSHDQYSQSQVQPQHTPAAPLDAGSQSQTPGAQPAGLPGMPNFDPAKTVKQIYPILAFRDKVVRTISGIIEKIPGLEALVDKIVETLTVFVLSLLAPFVRPVLEAISKSLQKGSEGVIDSSGRHQYEIWTDPRCSDPTHSMLSKDHFSNVLNEPAGMVAGEILKFIAPRVLYAWEHPDVPVDKVMADIDSIFHHPAIRNERIEVHRNMFNAVKQWKDSRSDRGRDLDNILSAESVRAGKNHKAGVNDHIGHGSSMAHPPTQHNANQSGLAGMYHQAQTMMGGQTHGGSHSTQQSGFSGMYHQVENLVGGQHQGGSNQQSQGGMGGMFQQAGNLYNQFSGHGSSGHSGGYGGSHSSGGGGGLNDMLSMANKLPIPGVSNLTSTLGKFSSFVPGGRTRGMDDTPSGTRSMGDSTSGGDNESRDRGHEAGPGGADIAVDPAYSIFGGSNIGGAGDLHDALNRANQRDRSPSPMPLKAPSGYEEYGREGGSTQAYTGGEGRQYEGQYGAQQSGYGYDQGAQQHSSYGGSGDSGSYQQGGGSGSYYRS